MGIIELIIWTIYILGIISLIRLCFKRNVTRVMLTTDVIIISLAVIIWCIGNLI